VPLVPQPQDKISNKTKRLLLILEKEHSRIPRIVVHHNKDIPLPTLKDRLGDQRGGSEWEPIRILLEGD
jgi:hypothetical protein